MQPYNSQAKIRATLQRPAQVERSTEDSQIHRLVAKIMARSQTDDHPSATAPPLQLASLLQHIGMAWRALVRVRQNKAGLKAGPGDSQA